MNMPPSGTNIANPPSDPRLRISTLTPSGLNTLKTLYQYQSIKQKITTTGWLNVFLGAFTIWLGSFLVSRDIFAVFHLLIGCLIVGVSLWAIIAPSARVILLDSVIFAVCGIWNILIPIRYGFHSLSPIILFLGLLQLWWTFQYYKLYKDAVQMSFAKPSSEAMNLYNQIWSEIGKISDRDKKDYIELKMRGKLWRGLLLPKLAVFAAHRRKMLIVSDRANVSFIPNNSNFGSRVFQGRFTFNAIVSPAVFPRPSLERFTHWKESDQT